LILDVGCGNNPKGDVNCDLYVKKTEHRAPVVGAIETKRVKNFVLCDCGSEHFKFLPFRSKVFSVARCYHVLEHLERFDKTIKEMTRVAKNEVDIRTPHRFWRPLLFIKGQKSTHINFFSVKYLGRIVQLLGYNAEIHVRYGFPLRIPFLVAPREIVMKIHLRGRK